MALAHGVCVPGLAESGSARSADTPPRSHVTADVLQDGNILLVLTSTDLATLPELHMADLAGAAPDRRMEIVREFLSGRYAGVLIGSGGRTAAVAKNSCDNLVECAKSVKRICKSVGSKAVSVSITNGCSGSCESGMDVALSCADP